MEARVLVVLAQKGGVGKTTLSVSLAHALTTHGRVLLIDTDSQNNISAIFGRSPYPGLIHLFDGDLERAITRDVREGLDVIYAESESTIELANRLSAQPLGALRLRTSLKPLREHYHTIVIDTAPSVNILHTSALVASDAFLIVVQLDYLAVLGVQNSLETFERIPEELRTSEFLGVVPNYWERVTRITALELRGLQDAFGTLLYPPLPLDVGIRESSRAHKTPWEYLSTDSAGMIGRPVKENGVPVYYGGLIEIAKRLAFDLHGSV